MLERLQKIIAQAGVASRRHAEALIRAGEVTVNGQVVTELGTKADAKRDYVRVAGRLVRLVESKVYIALHKPDGVVATLRDPEGRPTIGDLLRSLPGRVFPVGRLEYHTSGLMLLTNDGELANQMMRAHELRQEYLCKIDGALSDAEIHDAERTFNMKMERAKGMPAGWWMVRTSRVRKDEFRQAFIASGHHVDKLRRIAIGSLDLGALAPGEYQYVTREEIATLQEMIEKAKRKGVRGKEAGVSERKRPVKLRRKQVQRKRNPWEMNDSRSNKRR